MHERLCSTQELTQHWALSPADLALTIGYTDQGKLGLACQLAFWREHARFPEIEADLAPAVVEHLAAQIGAPARWTVKFTKAKPDAEGVLPRTDLAIPVFGYQSHISIDRSFGFTRTWAATDAATYGGRLLREGLLDKTNTAGAVWADTAYRSQANERFMAENGFVSRVHRKKPSNRLMPVRTARANGTKSKVRAGIEHVFAEQKSHMGLLIRTVGLARARVKIGLANLVYNVKRLVFWERQAGILPA